MAYDVSRPTLQCVAVNITPEMVEAGIIAFGKAQEDILKGEGDWVMAVYAAMRAVEPATMPDKLPQIPDAAIYAAMDAMQNAVITDDEGEFPRLFDLLDYSGENKARTITHGLAHAALYAAAPFFLRHVSHCCDLMEDAVFGYQDSRLFRQNLAELRFYAKHLRSADIDELRAAIREEAS